MKVAAIILAVAAPVGLVLWLIRRGRTHRAKADPLAEEIVSSGIDSTEKTTPVAPAGACTSAPDVFTDSLRTGNDEAATEATGIPRGQIVSGEAPSHEAEEQPAKTSPAILIEEHDGAVPEQVPVTEAGPQLETAAPQPAGPAVDGVIEVLLEQPSEASSVTPSTLPEFEPPREDGRMAESDGAIEAQATPVADGELPAIAQTPEPGLGTEAPGAGDTVSPGEDAEHVTADEDAAGGGEKPETTSPAAVEGKPEYTTRQSEASTATDGTPSAIAAIAEELPAFELDLGESGHGDATEEEAAPAAAAPLYRPVAPRPPRPRRPGAARTENGDRSPARELELDIRVHITLSRFGLRDLTFLPVRSSEVEDSEIRVRLAAANLTLIAQEDWYQDLFLEDTGGYLRRGIELRGTALSGRHIRWLLSGRTLYILAMHPRANAYVSTNRLMIGRPHVVLCTADSFAPVEEMLRRAGCEGFSRLGEGVPDGWIALRDVNPKQAILDDLGDSLLNAVKPTPDIEIDFEGGVCLRNQDWLAGYPPEIRVLGLTGQIKPFIDDREAEVLDGRLYAEGYDLPGAHTVYCEGLPHSRTYSIVEPAEDWSEWPAYHFRDADICGPLVQITGNATKHIIVPMTNPVLIGAEGQIFRCSARHAAQWKGYVPFDAVWALPAQPFTCNKKTSRIIQLGRAPVGSAAAQSRTARSWSTAIMNASRKGLQLDGGSSEDALLWREYRKAARAIWRAAR